MKKYSLPLLILVIYFVTITITNSYSLESLKSEPEDDSDEWVVLSDGHNPSADGYIILKRGPVGGAVLKDILGKRKRNVGGIVLKDLLGKKKRSTGVGGTVL